MICLSWAEYRFSFQQYICFNDAGTSVPFFLSGILSELKSESDVAT